jgi:hypothetical protein
MCPEICHDLPQNRGFDQDNHISSGVVRVNPLFQGDWKWSLPLFLICLAVFEWARIYHESVILNSGRLRNSRANSRTIHLFPNSFCPGIRDLSRNNGLVPEERTCPGRSDLFRNNGLVLEEVTCSGINELFRNTILFRNKSLILNYLRIKAIQKVNGHMVLCLLKVKFF